MQGVAIITALAVEGDGGRDTQMLRYKDASGGNPSQSAQETSRDVESRRRGCTNYGHDPYLRVRKGNVANIFERRHAGEALTPSWKAIKG